MLLDGLASSGVAANTDHLAVLDQEALDGEFLADLGPRFGGRVHEQLVQDRAPRRVGDGCRGCARSSGDRERAEVECIRVHGRATGCQNAFEQSPVLERRDAGWMDQMRRDGVAREGRPVDQQHPVALAGKQHRRRRSGAPRADDDRVEWLAHGFSSFVE